MEAQMKTLLVQHLRQWWWAWMSCFGFAGWLLSLPALNILLSGAMATLTTAPLFWASWSVRR